LLYCVLKLDSGDEHCFLLPWLESSHVSWSLPFLLVHVAVYSEAEYEVHVFCTKLLGNAVCLKCVVKSQMCKSLLSLSFAV